MGPRRVHGSLYVGNMQVRPLDPMIISHPRANARPQAVLVRESEISDCGLVVACPHSGRFYPDEMLAASCLDPFTLRRSEDAFVDELFAGAPDQGADLLINRFARAFVDVNRSAGELDGLLIANLSPLASVKPTERVKAGLGVIPRTVGDGMSIYRSQIEVAGAEARLAEVYYPWHKMVEAQLHKKHDRFGISLLLDCHSMPDAASGEPSVDIVLGDRFGASCAPLIMHEATTFLRECGFKLGRNDPYAGGYSTIRHANVIEGRHAFQIEINRSLYMVEGALTKRPCFNDIAEAMGKLVKHLADVSVAVANKHPVIASC
jgi:N-formylglutamate amidohydrolase